MERKSKASGSPLVIEGKSQFFRDLAEMPCCRHDCATDSVLSLSSAQTDSLKRIKLRQEQSHQLRESKLQKQGTHIEQAVEAAAEASHISGSHGHDACW
eukprot:8983-Heterococcus_DN1.PRE.6